MLNPHTNPLRFHYERLPHEVNEDGSWTILGDVDVGDSMLTSLECGIRIAKVKGDYFCDGNKLTNLRGAPEEIEGDFNCSFNQLRDLVWGPRVVGGGYECEECGLSSLTGSPKRVRSFCAASNRLPNLIGGPSVVNTVFDVSSNRITSLVGAPRAVGSDFKVAHNKLKNLMGAPSRVLGSIDLRDNPWESFIGAPDQIGMRAFTDLPSNEIRRLVGKSVASDPTLEESDLPSKLLSEATNATKQHMNAVLDDILTDTDTSYVDSGMDDKWVVRVGDDVEVLDVEAVSCPAYVGEVGNVVRVEGYSLVVQMDDGSRHLLYRHEIKIRRRKSGRPNIDPVSDFKIRNICFEHQFAHRQMNDPFIKKMVLNHIKRAIALKNDGHNSVEIDRWADPEWFGLFGVK